MALGVSRPRLGSRLSPKPTGKIYTGRAFFLHAAVVFHTLRRRQPAVKLAGPIKTHGDPDETAATFYCTRTFGPAPRRQHCALHPCSRWWRWRWWRRCGRGRRWRCGWRLRRRWSRQRRRRWSRFGIRQRPGQLLEHQRQCHRHGERRHAGDTRHARHSGNPCHRNHTSDSGHARDAGHTGNAIRCIGEEIAKTVPPPPAPPCAVAAPAGALFFEAQWVSRWSW